MIVYVLLMSIIGQPFVPVEFHGDRAAMLCTDAGDQFRAAIVAGGGREWNVVFVCVNKGDTKP